MQITKVVKDILSNYESDNPGTKANLARILMAGKLGGTGKMIILPVDQGFEHGPVRSFHVNPEAYDPLYHYGLAVEAGLNAYAAPLGMLEAGASQYAGAIPTILKVNSGNTLISGDLAPDQAITGSVQDALRLGCSAIGFTIYPGSDNTYGMIEQIREMAEEAKACGLAVVIWSYPRGQAISKAGETGLDVIAYAAHMAALLGAHIIKVKLPSDHIEGAEAKKAYEKMGVSHVNQSLTHRVKHVVDCCFKGRRMVVFSGGVAKDNLNDLYSEIQAIKDGGGNGTIIGRNTFQRPKAEALQMLDKIIEILKK